MAPIESSTSCGSVRTRGRYKVARLESTIRRELYKKEGKNTIRDEKGDEEERRTMHLLESGEIRMVPVPIKRPGVRKKKKPANSNNSANGMHPKTNTQRDREENRELK